MFVILVHGVWPHSFTNDEVMAIGIARHSSDQKKTICWSHSVTSGNQTLALEWIHAEGGRRRVGRPMQTWQDTLQEDLETMGVDWSGARDTASDRPRWIQLVA